MLKPAVGTPRRLKFELLGLKDSLGKFKAAYADHNYT